MASSTKKSNKSRGFQSLLPPKLLPLGKVAIFVDAANILYSQQTIGWKVDYKKMIELFKKELDVIFAGFYYGQVSTNQGQKNFFSMLKDRGYTIRTKPVKYIKTPKGIILKEKFDTCILLSGDSDFEILVKHLRTLKKQVIVVSAKKHISIELIRNCDKYVNLKKLRELIERKN